MTLTLGFPTDEDETRVLDLEKVLTTENFSFLAGHTVDEQNTWRDVLAMLRREHEGTDLPADRVPADFLLAVLPGEPDGADSTEQIIGRASIRYGLTDYLLKYDGHIGYAVAPGTPSPGLRHRDPPAVAGTAGRTRHRPGAGDL
ncbi:GNAT family N-acetyltransferase [Candidatus Corynebacterium faecigallinarum]|uniref:GNAT family N-acetyltransferase n=1 Tax=Candidatus Corynebacterium faecigallinarum TaxID=2838528 RepID=UPI003FD27A96